MPLSQSGKYFANPRHAQQHDEQQAGADPNQDPQAQPADQETSVTITKRPDGSFQTSEDNGQQMDHPDFQSAMAQAQQCLDPDAGMGPDVDGDAGDENDATGQGSIGSALQY